MRYTHRHARGWCIAKFDWKNERYYIVGFRAKFGVMVRSTQKWFRNKKNARRYHALMKYGIDYVINNR